MTSANMNLKVGDRVLVIGCAKPENRLAIGTIVTIEMLLNEDTDITRFYPSPLPESYTHVHGKAGSAVVSGCVITGGVTLVNRFHMLPNHAQFQQKHLMPLPPLEDPGIDDCTFTPIKNQEPVAC